MIACPSGDAATLLAYEAPDAPIATGSTYWPLPGSGQQFYLRSGPGLNTKASAYRTMLIHMRSFVVWISGSIHPHRFQSLVTGSHNPVFGTMQRRIRGLRAVRCAAAVCGAEMGGKEVQRLPGVAALLAQPALGERKGPSLVHKVKVSD